MLSPFSRLYVTIFRDALPRRLCLMLLPLVCLACDGVSRLDDTLGLQSSARWEWHGRLVVEPDSALTLVRMAIDTAHGGQDRKSTRLNSSHGYISYAVFCLKKKKKENKRRRRTQHRLQSGCITG